MPNVFHGVDATVMQRLRSLYIESLDDNTDYGSSSPDMDLSAASPSPTNGDSTSVEEEGWLAQEPEVRDHRQSIVNSVRFRQRRNASPNILEQVDVQQLRRRFCNHFHHNDDEEEEFE